MPTNTVIYPSTVMIVLRDAGLTNRAVMFSWIHLSDAEHA